MTKTFTTQEQSVLASLALQSFEPSSGSISNTLTQDYDPERLAKVILSWLLKLESQGQSISLQLRSLRVLINRELLHFCARHGILKYLLVSVDLIEKYFSPIQDLTLQPEEDPETGEEWLTLNIAVQGEIDEVLNKYEAYTNKLVDLIPWPECDKIRLSYNII